MTGCDRLNNPYRDQVLSICKRTSTVLYCSYTLWLVLFKVLPQLFYAGFIQLKKVKRICRFVGESCVSVICISHILKVKGAEFVSTTKRILLLEPSSRDHSENGVRCPWSWSYTSLILYFNLNAINFIKERLFSLNALIITKNSTFKPSVLFKKLKWKMWKMWLSMSNVQGVTILRIGSKINTFFLLYFYLSDI